MNLIICVDKNGGMLLFGKRLSSDKILNEKILGLIGENQLFLNSYTAKQFANTEKLFISDNFLSNAGENDFCFLETDEIPIEKVKKLYIFNWNRDYPADVFFDVDLNLYNFKKIKKEEFQGNSHKKITMEIYSKE